MTIYHHPGFAAPLGNHIMPIAKFDLVAQEISQNLPGFSIQAAEPIAESDLLQVHTADYVRAIRTGVPVDLAESQKFPWSPQLYPSVCLTNGGVLAAAGSALSDGCSAALASGFHHACADHGEGFCTFNGLVVASESLRRAGRIRTVAVLDMDLHYGNGTASLAPSRPWMRVLSIYGNDYWNNEPFRDVRVRHHEDGDNHFSVPLVPTGSSDRALLLETLEANLGWLVANGKPDLLLYQAGADPLKDDPYSPLDLNHDDLMERDRHVFRFAKEQEIPVAWVLAGGYSRDINKVVAVHVNTARASIEVFGRISQ